MDIVEFFRLSAGKWSSIRSSHDLTSGQQVANKATLQFDWLDSTAAEVVELCDHQGVDPGLALCGLRLGWEDVTDLGKKQSGNAVLVAIANSQEAQEGQLLQAMGTTSLTGRYHLSNDKLCLITELPDGYREEQLWFESENVRLRSSMLKNSQGASVASFYSEVRLMTTPPKE